MKQNYFVYILRCSDKSLYTGITNDVDKRIKAHNAGRAAKYTYARRPVKLLHTIKLRSKSAALKREAQIKSLTKAAKEALLIRARTRLRGKKRSC